MLHIFRSRPSGVYDLRVGSEVVPVHCEMRNDECGSGGWTLAMKIDGTKVNFFLDSATFLLLHFLLAYKKIFFLSLISEYLHLRFRSLE